VIDGCGYGQVAPKSTRFLYASSPISHVRERCTSRCWYLLSMIEDKGVRNLAIDKAILVTEPKQAR